MKRMFYADFWTFLAKIQAILALLRDIYQNLLIFCIFLTIIEYVYFFTG